MLAGGAKTRGNQESVFEVAKCSLYVRKFTVCRIFGVDDITEKQLIAVCDRQF